MDDDALVRQYDTPSLLIKHACGLMSGEALEQFEQVLTLINKHEKYSDVKERYDTYKNHALKELGAENMGGEDALEYYNNALKIYNQSLSNILRLIP